MKVGFLLGLEGLEAEPTDVLFAHLAVHVIAPTGLLDWSIAIGTELAVFRILLNPILKRHLNQNMHT